MTAPTLALTQTNLITAVGNYIVALFPTLSVSQGQQNRVPEPAGSDFVIITPTLRTRLGTDSISSWTGSAPTVVVYTAPTQVTIQSDIHGPNSADNAQVLFTLFRSENATDFFAATGFDLAPLYAADPVQLPFLNSEDQYEDRWTVDLVLQANPTVSAAQDFASTVQVTLEPADA